MQYETLKPKMLAGSKLFWSKLKYFILCMVIIIGFSALFGFENIYIAIGLATALLTYKPLDIGLSPKSAAGFLFGSFLLIGLSSWANQLGVWVSVPINFVAVYLLTVCTSTNLEQKAYIPLVLCFVFVQGNQVIGRANVTRMLGFVFAGAIVAICYYYFHRKQPQPQGLKAVLAGATRFSEQTQFSLRMAVALTAAMLIGGLLRFDRPMWLGIVTFAMTRPFFSDTLSRIKHRTFGCVVGTLCFAVLCPYIIDPKYTAVLLMVCGFFSSVPSRYGFQQIFVTINALGVATFLIGEPKSIALRLLFLGGGIGIALLCYLLTEKLVFPLIRTARSEDVTV